MSACSTTRPTARPGFTLVEVLIALTLAATVLTALFALFDTVSDVERQTGARFAESRAMRTVFGVLEEDLRSLKPAGDDAVLASVQQSDFNQDEVLLSMVTASSLSMTARVPHLGMQLVEYSLRGGGDGRRLVRTERPYANVLGDFEPTEIVLAEGVLEVEMGFYDVEYHEFRDDWDPAYEGTAPPAAVRMRLVLGDENSEQEYELVVPLSFEI